MRLVISFAALAQRRAISRTAPAMTANYILASLARAASTPAL